MQNSKPQNIYDDPAFFAGYKHLRETRSGLNDDVEQPAFHRLLPSLADRTVLELGCGMGGFARFCVEGGAKRVVAVDVSEKMLAVARQQNACPEIEYRRAAMEELAFAPESLDLVASSLALHYVADYAGLVGHIATWLRSGGLFVFSTEHPLCTASLDMPGWISDETGQKRYWPLDNYGDEGERRQTWFVEGVVKYHRKLSTLANGLIDAGLHIERIEEPEAVPEAVARRPELVQERRRPSFVLFRAAKP